MKIDPRPIAGPWDVGFTLDVHTVSAEFLGYDLDGRPLFDTLRSEIGELLFSSSTAATAARAERSARLPPISFAAA
jgi:hypothetical protein